MSASGTNDLREIDVIPVVRGCADASALGDHVREHPDEYVIVSVESLRRAEIALRDRDAEIGRLNRALSRSEALRRAWQQASR